MLSFSPFRHPRRSFPGADSGYWQTRHVWNYDSFPSKCREYESCGARAGFGFTCPARAAGLGAAGPRPAPGTVCRESLACCGNRLCLQKVSLIRAALCARALSGSRVLRLRLILAMACGSLPPTPAADSRPSRLMALAQAVRRGRARVLVLSWKLPKDPPDSDVWDALGEKGCCGTAWRDS